MYLNFESGGSSNRFFHFASSPLILILDLYYIKWTRKWNMCYNRVDTKRRRPHGSLGYLTPNEMEANFWDAHPRTPT